MDNRYAELQRRISIRAHKIWIEEGCPEDRGVEHWNRAAEQIAAEDWQHARARPATAPRVSSS